MNAARRYVSAQKETASPERLMLLLFETALRHMRAGSTLLEAGRSAEANAPLSKAAEIVNYLAATFDAKAAPKLAENLGAVYRFVATRLISGNLGHDASLVREAEQVFAPIAEAFSTAVGQLPAAGAR